MSQAFKTQFIACLLSYKEWIVQMSQVSKTQFFAFLLALLVGWPYFRLRVVVGLIGLTVDLIIGKAESISRKVAIGFSRCSL